MQLTSEQFAQIAASLPRQRGNVSLDNLQVLNAILHVAANGCKWRARPESYGNWHTNLHAHDALGPGGRARPRVRATPAPAPDAGAHRVGVSELHHHAGAPGCGRGAKKNGPQALGRSRGGWSTKLHLVAADARNVVTWSLTPGQAGDAPEGRRLIQEMGPA